MFSPRYVSARMQGEYCGRSSVVDPGWFVPDPATDPTHKTRSSKKTGNDMRRYQKRKSSYKAFLSFSKEICMYLPFKVPKDAFDHF